MGKDASDILQRLKKALWTRKKKIKKEAQKKETRKGDEKRRSNEEFEGEKLSQRCSGEIESEKWMRVTTHSTRINISCTVYFLKQSDGRDFEMIAYANVLSIRSLCLGDHWNVSYKYKNEEGRRNCKFQGDKPKIQLRREANDG